MSLYEVLKASKTERFPDYWTLLWGRKMSASMIKTITGVLPLTFTAKGGTAADWVIEGNDENGTENLMQIIATSKTQNGIIFTVDGDGRITINGTATGVAVIYLDWRWGGNAVNAVEPNTTYTVTGGLNTTGVTFFWGTFNSDSTITETAIATTATITTGTKAEKSRAYIYITEGAVCDNLVCEPMLVEGSTAPDHYIPYQQGVGERTAQLFTDTVGKQVITAVAAGTSFVTSINNPMTLAAGRYTIHYYQSTSMTSNTRNTLLVFALATDVQTYESSATNHKLDAGWYSWTFDIPNDGSYQMRIWIVNPSDEVKATNFILTKGETATPTEYIPHGYQVPLTVSQQGQTDKSYTFYIGDTPLTEGETVSKTSTGVDIELFGGENTISTTLYNKPEMKIKYK